MQTKTQVLVISCVVVLTFTAGTAQAQRRGFGFGVNKLRIAVVAEVAQELKFDEEQTALAKKLSDEDREQARSLIQNTTDQEERRKKFQELQSQRAEREQQLEKALGEEKAKRLGQLVLQVTGLARAVGDREVAEKLGVTQEQRTQFREAGQGLREQIRSAGNDAEARAKVMRDYRDKITGLLTDEQKTKWQELIGKPAGDELLEKIRTATSPRRRQDT